jgi:tetratricopeptide (TPR) repeat protein
MDKLHYLFYAILLSCVSIYAQESDPAKEKALRASKNLTWEANQELSSDNFIQAEAEYRKAISKSDKNSIAPYNLGNAYYKNDSYSEAFGRFKQAGEVASQKENKHKAFHNMGNVFMKRKEYDKAIEAYKEALRNNPSDEETRYNLALAKELAKKEKDQQKDGDKEEEKDQKDKKEEDQDKENKGDNKEDQEKKDEDKKDGDEEDQEKEENKKGEGDDKKEQPKQGQQPEEQKQPRPNQLSPQQIKNLLEAMQNEERKVQEKMDAKKVKGVKTKNVKDW